MGPFARAGQRLIEHVRGPSERRFVVPERLDSVDELALLRIGQLLAREPARMRPQRPHVRREPWVFADLLQQLLRFLRERNRLARLLRADAPIRAVVGVDEVVVMLSEPQAELDVPPGRAQRANSAACPCPTPTQSVASP